MVKIKQKKMIIAVSILLLMSICLMVRSGLWLWQCRQVYQVGDQRYQQLKQQVGISQRENRTISNSEYKEDDQAEAVDNRQQANLDFNALSKINADAVAWLSGPGTVIDYPVMLAYDYDWYLHHLPDGTANANGSLFFDVNNPKDLSGRLNIIYGHHLKSGKMFGSLTSYKKQEYFVEHPFLFLYTEQYDYQIDLKYGCLISAGEWREQAFMYEVNLTSLLAYASSRTTFQSDLEYTEEDRFIVLSTCSYEFDDARYLVIGVLRPITNE